MKKKFIYPKDTKFAQFKKKGLSKGKNKKRNYIEMISHYNDNEDNFENTQLNKKVLKKYVVNYKEEKNYNLIEAQIESEQDKSKKKKMLLKTLLLKEKIKVNQSII